MIERTEIVNAARDWLGTPFHHQARLKTIGVDCIGLVIGVARELGMVQPDFDVTGYSRYPEGRSLMAMARQQMNPITLDRMQIGDVVVVGFEKLPQHFGIIGDYRHGGFSIIHAASAYGKVVEQRLMFSKAMFFVAAFQLPGVQSCPNS
jgi:cell wall-associated NlpC family hydrolase